MTYSDLTFYETEVIEVVDKVLDAVKAKNFENYILLIARGGYQYEIEKTFLSPYVISSRQEIYLDRTRDKFLVAYLNNYATLLKDGVFMDNEYKEYDLNIQMMIYAQIWESHQFLKSLKRIGDILIGKPYEWKIPFEKPDKNGVMRPVHKGNMIQEQILNTLRRGNPDFARFIDPSQGGSTSFMYTSINMFQEGGVLRDINSVAQSSVHELFHTVRVAHPFELTQSPDTELISIGPNSYITTHNTDPNIVNNIMNYGKNK